MLKHLKYYTALYRHNMSREIARDEMGKNFLGTLVLAAVFGGAAGSGMMGGDTQEVDQISATNAMEVVAQLETQSLTLQEQQDAFDDLSKRITVESRAGNDIDALGAEQEQAAEALNSFAQQLVANTLLSDELSEQQRQDFLTVLDENVIDLSDIGFEALDNGDEVDPLSHLREYTQTEKDGQGYTNNIERAQAMAEYNNENNNVLSPVLGGGAGSVIGVLFVLVGVLLGVGSAHRYAYDKPKKPTSRSGHFKH